jgi:hypothetical protein
MQRTSGKHLANGLRFQLIDDQNRPDHYHLTAGDECYFLYEYTSGKNYSFSETNGLISNLKKKPSQSDKPGYHYKARAIDRCARELTSVINPKWLAQAILVPVPPSKARDHPDYDDRMMRICRGIGAGVPNVRELVNQRVSLEAAHETKGPRPSVDQLMAVYEIDESVADLSSSSIGIVDDVLTAGTHFLAVKTILQRRFTGIRVVGLFIARRVFASPFEEDDSS